MKLNCLICVLIVGALAAMAAADELTVIEGKLDGVEPKRMLETYLSGLAQQAFARRRQVYDKIKTAADIAAYQKRTRQFFVDQLGGFPKRTPLNARVVGRIEREDFIVEKILFESRPNFLVSAALYLPKRKSELPSGKYPGVLFVCGHSSNGKANNKYQTACILLARNGIAAFAVDPIDQGERMQIVDANGKYPFWGTKGHTNVGIGSILLGQNTARFEIWDGMRAIDYMQSRDEIDPKRIGCMGNSGGGTQTSYMMALEDRIVAATPSCYITSFPRLLKTIGPQDAEQDIYGQIAFGMDHADYLMMRAPTPILICCATRDFFDIQGTWDSFRQAKRLYTRMGYAERVDLIESDQKHGFDRPLRTGAVRWMRRWLLGKDDAISEPDIKILKDQELWASPKGQVQLIKGAVTVYDLNRGENKELAGKRAAFWKDNSPEKAMATVRQIVGMRSLSELPKAKVKLVGTVDRGKYKIEKLLITGQKDIAIPALAFIPDKSTGVTVYVHEKGKAAEAKPGGAIERMVKQGQLVVAIDVRGAGETGNAGFKQFFTAYLLGRSLVGMRADDILVASRAASDRYNSKGKSPRPFRLIAVGHIGVPALHAAANAPQQFASVELHQCIPSWSMIYEKPIVRNQLVNAVHGALRLYDLPDLGRILEGKLKWVDPVDGAGVAINE